MELLKTKLLLRCQEASYQLLEDLRQLHLHPLVSDAPNPNEAFMSLINRRMLVEGDPTVGSGMPRKDLILHFGFKPDAEHKPIMEEANRILSIYDTYNVEGSATRLPPPIWLRLLPICLQVTQDLGLWGTDSPIKLRFISFAMEPVRKGKDKYETFVNINSDSPRLKIEEYLLSNGQPSKSLNRALFGSFYTDRLEDIGRLISCVWWGIRFRTSESHEEPLNANWLDVRVDPNQQGKEYKAEVRFPRQISEESLIGLKRLFKDWAFDMVSDDERDAIALDTPSEQIFAYVKVNQRAFPNRQLPKSGMDCLICPGVFWSADPFLWGTGITTVYGFEGYLEENISNLLLSLTQQLMMAPTIFSQVIKLKESSERAGRYNVLHNITKDIRAVIAGIIKYNKQRERFLLKYKDAGISVEDVPSIPAPDKLGVTLMFLAAEDPEERQLKQLPIDLAKDLGKPWTQEFLTKFVDRVVWEAVQGRVVTDQKIKKAIGARNFTEEDLAEEAGAFEKPKLIMPKSIQIKHAENLYPLFLVALRSAYQHAYLHAVLNSRDGRRGVVELTYDEDDEREYIHIKNNGSLQEGGQITQRGWIRDVAVFEGLTDGWAVDIKDRTKKYYSIWKRGQWYEFEGYWITTLSRPFERNSNGAAL